MKNTLLLELKGEASFHEMIPRKNPKKLETDIVSCVSLIKQHWKKVAEITKKWDFLSWRIQNFVREVKQLLQNIILLD